MFTYLFIAITESYTDQFVDNGHFILFFFLHGMISFLNLQLTLRSSFLSLCVTDV